MYYNSNNNDYYNSYKKELAELEAYRKEESTQKVIRFILYFLIIFLFIVTVFYLYKYFNPIITKQNSFLQQETLTSKNKPLPNIVIREEELPQSIQLLESNVEKRENISSNPTNNQKSSIKNTHKAVSSMSEQDIALIVKIIMSQMNAKVEKPLEQQLEEVSEQKFVNKDLKKTNHYNKIILTENEIKDIKNSSLMQLKSSLNNIINELVLVDSNYTKALKNELLSRKNEMRIMIVREGDTLSKIAKRAYGNNADYKKILSANPEIIKNPNQIFVGQRLRIPS